MLPVIESLAVGRPDPISNNLGVKGVGEPPIIPTPAAIANAVANAVGARVTSLPITPAKVRRALEAADGAAASKPARSGARSS
jgi:xanthine dehydrogenase YagR molybdenum-binding subunit